MTDDRIIELYWNRDEAAVAETDKKYGRYCQGIAGKILSTREDVEETVADTWIQTWNTIPPQRPSYFNLFLAKITRNLAFNRYRKMRREQETVSTVLEELNECAAGEKSAEDEVLYRDLVHQLNRFLSHLPKREREIFVRRYFYTDSVSEIAKRYDLRSDHIYMILSRTRKKLQEQLKEGFG